MNNINIIEFVSEFNDCEDKALAVETTARRHRFKGSASLRVGRPNSRHTPQSTSVEPVLHPPTNHPDTTSTTTRSRRRANQLKPEEKELGPTTSTLIPASPKTKSTGEMTTRKEKKWPG